MANPGQYNPNLNFGLVDLLDGHGLLWQAPKKNKSHREFWISNSAAGKSERGLIILNAAKELNSAWQ